MRRHAGAGVTVTVMVMLTLTVRVRASGHSGDWVRVRLGFRLYSKAYWASGLFCLLSSDAFKC